MFGANFADDLGALARTTNRPIDVIFDVGANHGLMTQYFRRHFPEARIHCFEPNPFLYASLQQSFAPDKRIVVVPKALADAPGTADFYCRENDLLSSLSPITPTTRKFPSAASKIEVTVSTVDEYVANAAITKLALIKIDTEGHEVEVLRGAEETLRRHAVDYVYLEFNSIVSTELGLPLMRAAEILEAHGYHFIATYTDSVSLADGHVVANALFSRPVRTVSPEAAERAL